MEVDDEETSEDQANHVGKQTTEIWGEDSERTVVASFFLFRSLRT